MRLPSAIPIRIPSMLGGERLKVKDTVVAFNRNLPIPRELRSYLISIVTVVQTRGDTVGGLMGTRAITSTLQEAKEKSQEPCQCQFLFKSMGYPWWMATASSGVGAF